MVSNPVKTERVRPYFDHNEVHYPYPFLYVLTPSGIDPIG